MIRVLVRLVIVAVCSICSSANSQIENNQVIDLYCEGTDYASYDAKHILVSINRNSQQISITDPLRETPRILKLIETQSFYKARGDHSAGFLNLEEEKTSAASEAINYCQQGQTCEVYLLYTVDFTLNRMNGSFKYLISREIRESETNALLKTADEWGIFKNTHCKALDPKY